VQESKVIPAMSQMTVSQFFERFPDDETCLNHVFEVRFGSPHVCRACGKESTFHRLQNRRAWACAACGDNLYPTAGTIFEDTRTPLRIWFYVIYLFCTTRHGVSGKEIQRVTGTTYKTSWRMGQQIRKLMDKANGFAMLQGHVEADEAYIGGHRPGRRGRGAAGKTIVMGIKERGGRMATEILRDAKTASLREAMFKNVERGAVVSTDEFYSYGLLKGEGYEHGLVKHSAKQWKDGIHHTNSVESFWKLFKNSIRSTHISVSPKYMDRYLKEFTFRANHREMGNAMFDLLIASV
jgi:transposase-like protein